LFRGWVKRKLHKGKRMTVAIPKVALQTRCWRDHHAYLLKAKAAAPIDHWPWRFTVKFSRFRESSPRRETAVPDLLSQPFIVAGAVVLVALGGTLLLWAYVGTVVFFETIRNGFAMCFG
jgi:hypothetical protein